MNSPNLLSQIAQKLPNRAVAEQLQIMLQHFETYNFLQIDKNNLEFNINGQTLKETIRSEWFLKNITLSENPAFCLKELKSKNCFKTSFQKIMNMVSALPFSLIETYKKPVSHKPMNLTSNIVDLMKTQLQIDGGTILKNQTLCSPQMAYEIFHKQQRERKIWWRKFSAVPGRFNTTEISFHENSKSVEIKADFPWGPETVEVIKYLPDELLHDQDSFQEKNNKRNFVPHVITCETSLETITMTYLCDSFEISNDETSNKVLRFSRKLAPFKVAFAAKCLVDEAEHMKDLATLLAKQIRKKGISVLLLPDICSTSLDRQISRNDAIGVPFTVIFNERTLRDGIISIRSRDTTLKEQSHVSLIVAYLEKLMKTG